MREIVLKGAGFGDVVGDLWPLTLILFVLATLALLDKADAEKICSQKATEEMTRRMAEYRRGRWYDVGAVVTSAAFIVDLPDLDGRKRIEARGTKTHALLAFGGH